MVCSAGRGAGVPARYVRYAERDHPRARRGGVHVLCGRSICLDQKLIELMVSAIEFRNRLIDGAMPVDARKKPKSTATIAGPALIVSGAAASGASLRPARGA